ncbi:MAG: 50S ribosomal protein L29 [Acidobacteriota bacterium]|nr:50S ribosomal protein L29 [Acidobacteriota bacterium]MDH3528478.1 50S ribosomal protein L29 [Acidobacteriota bacterium]
MKRGEQLDQLREMDIDELREQADSLKESLFRLKFRKSLGVGDVVADIRREKKTLARVYTLMRTREIEAGKSAEKSA